MRSKRFIVLGLGQFGRAISRELSQLGSEVLAIDVSTKKVNEVRDDVAVAAVADIRDREALKELVTAPFDAAIIAIGGTMEASILAALSLKELGVKEIWAEATTPEREEVLRRVGVDHVLSPEREMGRRLAQKLANPNLVEFLPISPGYGIVQVEAPSWTHGKTLVDLDLRRQMGLAVIAIHRGEAIVIVPGANTELHPGDLVTVVGRDEDITRFREKK